jgi:hypothetical protein
MMNGQCKGYLLRGRDGGEGGRERARYLVEQALQGAMQEGAELEDVVQNHPQRLIPYRSRLPTPFHQLKPPRAQPYQSIQGTDRAYSQYTAWHSHAYMH